MTDEVSYTVEIGFELDDEYEAIDERVQEVLGHPDSSGAGFGAVRDASFFLPEKPQDPERLLERIKKAVGPKLLLAECYRNLEVDADDEDETLFHYERDDAQVRYWGQHKT